MVGIIVASHGQLAEGFMDALEMIMGPQEKITALALEPEMGPEDYREKLKKAAQDLETPDGVLIMADLFGGTPSNASAYLLDSENPPIEVVTGVNLPMLLEIANMRGSTGLKELAQNCRELATQSVQIMSEVMKKE